MGRSRSKNKMDLSFIMNMSPDKAATQIQSRMRGNLSRKQRKIAKSKKRLTSMRYLKDINEDLSRLILNKTNKKKKSRRKVKKTKPRKKNRRSIRKKRRTRKN